jgi:hypothetical protein
MRAAESGFRRQGTVSANGSCRLLRAGDGWVAVNLATETDIRSLAAVLGREPAGDPWAELRSHAASRSAAVVYSRLPVYRVDVGDQEGARLWVSEYAKVAPVQAQNSIRVSDDYSHIELGEELSFLLIVTDQGPNCRGHVSAVSSLRCRWCPETASGAHRHRRQLSHLVVPYTNPELIPAPPIHGPVQYNCAFHASARRAMRPCAACRALDAAGLSWTRSRTWPLRCTAENEA